MFSGCKDFLEAAPQGQLSEDAIRADPPPPVTAAIDYRIIERKAQLAVLFNQAFLTDEVVRAVGDMKASVRFF